MRTVGTSDAYVMPAAVGRRHGAAFWAVAFAFLVVMAFATLPSPLYGLYRARDDLSTLTVTLVYAVFACGAIGALLCERVVVARIGRAEDQPLRANALSARHSRYNEQARRVAPLAVENQGPRGRSYPGGPSD
jgi:hypothetical protein